MSDSATWVKYISEKTIPKSSGTAVTVGSFLTGLSKDEGESMRGFEIYDHSAAYKRGASDVKTGTDYQDVQAETPDYEECTVAGANACYVIAAADADITDVKVKVWGK